MASLEWLDPLLLLLHHTLATLLGIGVLFPLVYCQHLKLNQTEKEYIRSKIETDSDKEERMARTARATSTSSISSVTSNINADGMRSLYLTPEENEHYAALKKKIGRAKARPLMLDYWGGKLPTGDEAVDKKAKEEWEEAQKAAILAEEEEKEKKFVRGLEVYALDREAVWQREKWMRMFRKSKYHKGDPRNDKDDVAWEERWLKEYNAHRKAEEEYKALVSQCDTQIGDTEMEKYTRFRQTRADLRAINEQLLKQVKVKEKEYKEVADKKRAIQQKLRAMEEHNKHLLDAQVERLSREKSREKSRESAQSSKEKSSLQESKKTKQKRGTREKDSERSATDSGQSRKKVALKNDKEEDDESRK